jgi:hypothetical protein
VVMRVAWACTSFAGVDTGVVEGSTVDKATHIFRMWEVKRTLLKTTSLFSGLRSFSVGIS